MLSLCFSRPSFFSISLCSLSLSSFLCFHLHLLCNSTVATMQSLGFITMWLEQIADKNFPFYCAVSPDFFPFFFHSFFDSFLSLPLVHSHPPNFCALFYLASLHSPFLVQRGFLSFQFPLLPVQNLCCLVKEDSTFQCVCACVCVKVQWISVHPFL